MLKAARMVRTESATYRLLALLTASVCTIAIAGCGWSGTSQVPRRTRRRSCPSRGACAATASAASPIPALGAGSTSRARHQPVLAGVPGCAVHLQEAAARRWATVARLRAAKAAAGRDLRVHAQAGRSATSPTQRRRRRATHRTTASLRASAACISSCRARSALTLPPSSRPPRRATSTDQRGRRGEGGYSPRQTGSRFSRNAVIPSCASCASAFSVMTSSQCS